MMTNRLFQYVVSLLVAWNRQNMCTVFIKINHPKGDKVSKTQT